MDYLSMHLICAVQLDMQMPQVFPWLAFYVHSLPSYFSEVK